MNKNKLSRFLLSASAGIIATLGISEVKALSPAERAELHGAINQQVAEINTHKTKAVAHLKAKRPELTDEQAAELARKLVLHPSGLRTLNRLGDENTKELLDHFDDVLIGGVEFTPEHFDAFLSSVADADTLRALGLEDVRELKSQEAERLVAPAQVTSVEEALYFAKQRKHAGEFKAAAEFYLRARDLTESTNATVRTQYAEDALLMYSEHFVHHVARVSSVTDQNVADAQALLVSVQALAEATNTSKAFVRAAHCAKELGTAIHDLVLVEKAKKAKLEAAAAVDAPAVVAATTKIAKLYVDLYNADIVARNMHEKAADKHAGQSRNAQLVKAADAMRLAIGALSDSMEAKADAVFSGDVTVAVKLEEQAVAFNTMYSDLAETSGVSSEILVRTSAATASILDAKLKATWNARARFAGGTNAHTTLHDQYTAIRGVIDNTVASANTAYNNVTAADRYLVAKEIATVRLVAADKLYRDVLDAEDAGLPAAITPLADYVAANGSVLVVNGLDESLRATMDEVHADKVRHARGESHKVLAKERALVAKANARALERLAGAVLADDATRLEAYLTYARQADNKLAWEAGVTAADALLAVAAIGTPADGAGGDAARLVKALALTAKAEALLRRNTEANDTLVATVAADTGLLNAGLLFDANATAAAIADANRALRIRARNGLRRGLESAVNLHNTVAVKQGLRVTWSDVEAAYANDEIAVADAALVAAVGNSSLQEQNGDSWAAILAAFEGANTAANIRVAIRDALFADGGAAVVHQGGANPAARRAELVADTLANYFNGIDWNGAAGVVLAGDHAWTTVEGLYNDLKAEYDRIQGLAAQPYVGYTRAAGAFEKARTARSDWAKQAVADLSSAGADVFAARRTAAGQAYAAAADHETSRLRALFAAAGRGEYADAAFDTLNAVAGVLAANNGRLAAYYVTEDALLSLHRRSLSLKAAAEVYNQTRAAAGDAAAIAADGVARDAAVDLAVHGANVGAFQVGLGLVNAAFQGLAQYNADAGLGVFVGERLTAVSSAYRKATTTWLSDLTSTMSLLADADAMRAALQALLQDGAAVDAGVDLAGRIFALDARFAAGAAGGLYAETHQVRRDIALAYEAVLRSIVALSTADETLDVHQGHLYDALVVQATRANDIALTAYVPATPTTEAQMNQVIAQLTELANLSAAAGAGAYGATRSNTASDTTASFRAARGQAIDRMVQLINVKAAKDLANIVLLEQNADIATADRKARVAHELGRVLANHGKTEAMRHANIASDTHRSEARAAYLASVDAYNEEISLILSVAAGDGMPNRNDRLMEAYSNLSEAYMYAVDHGADAALREQQYEAAYKEAQILYREGHKERSMAALKRLADMAGASPVQGRILHELAEQYEAEGMFVEAAGVYKASAVNHVQHNQAGQAFKAAEKAFSIAEVSGHPEACVAAADAFKAVGAEGKFHRRVRAEAYHHAAGAYIIGEFYVDAADAYRTSADMWARMGDHMQAGNQYEKAAWALSKIAAITIAQRVQLIDFVGKAAHQLQIVGATQRLEKLVELAEAQFVVIDGDTTKLAAELNDAVIATATALYEKALVFQKEGDLAHAEAAEKRVTQLLAKVDAKDKEAVIHEHIRELYVLQKEHAKAINSFIEAATNFVEGKKFIEAAKAYKKAADAAVAGGQGRRILDEILPALMEISASVRTGGANAGAAGQFDIHLAVVEVYRDLVVLHPKEVDKAIAELAAVEAEAPTDATVKARIGAIKVSLLSHKARIAPRSQREGLLTEAQAAFDAVKDLTGGTPFLMQL